MLSGLKAIVFLVLSLPPVSSLQSAPQPGLLKVTSDPPGAHVTITSNDGKQVAATTNVSLVVTPGQYQVTAKSGSKSLKCVPTPAQVNSDQTITVNSGQTVNVVCN